MTGTLVVTGLNGQQQAASAAAFAEAGWTLRGTARAAGTHPLGPILPAELTDAAALTAAFAGADAVLFTLPQDHRPGLMPAMAKAVAEAAAAAKVPRLIANLGGTVHETSREPLFQDMRAVRATLLAGPVPAVILQPTVYLDNLLAPWSLPLMRESAMLAYAAPPEAPIGWVSHRTLGAAALAASTRDDLFGQILRVSGRDSLTGPELAARLRPSLPRPLTYQQVPLAQFAAGLNAAMGAPAGDRIASIYAVLMDEPEFMAANRDLPNRLQVEPESIEAFARRTLA